MLQINFFSLNNNNDDLLFKQSHGDSQPHVWNAHCLLSLLQILDCSIQLFFFLIQFLDPLIFYEACPKLCGPLVKLRYFFYFHRNIIFFYVVCFSLSNLTSSRVVGVIFSTNSLISNLYPSIIYTIFCRFSYALISRASVLSKIVFKTSSSLCSNIFAHHFSSSCFFFTFVRIVSSTSLATLVVSRFVASILDLD